MVEKVINLPQPELTLKQALIKSLQGNADAQSDYFNEVYARLLRSQADIGEATVGKCSNHRLCKLQDLESEALWEVIKSRAVERYQVEHKLAQLETLMHAGQNWYDQREFFLLASSIGGTRALEGLVPRNHLPPALHCSLAHATSYGQTVRPPL